MCGRYILEDKHKKVFTRFRLLEDTWNKEHEISPMYNISPGFIVPVITHNNKNKMEYMRWGLIPSWAKDPNIGYKLINARAESLSEKPSFIDSFKKRRCLIPASGFYEWKHSEISKIKIPYLFELKSHELFSMAGIYDIWKDAEGKEVMSFTIITTNPNKLMEPVHNRMPAILEQHHEEQWLDNSTQVEDIVSLLYPYPSEKMEAYTVSQEVNSPRNQSRNLIDKYDYATQQKLL